MNQLTDHKKEEIDNNIIIIGQFNICYHLLITHPDKINKKMLESSYTEEQINLIDTYTKYFIYQ